MLQITDSSKEILALLVLDCPEAEEIFAKCSTLYNIRELSKLSWNLTQERERQAEMNLKIDAAIVIQAFWRGILAKRKFRQMIGGFRGLQKLYK